MHPMTFPARDSGTQLPRRRALEFHLTAPVDLASPVHDARLSAIFFAPDGRQILWHGFWDGGYDWRIRYAPDQEGTWRCQFLLQDHRGAQLTTATGDLAVIYTPGGGEIRLDSSRLALGLQATWCDPRTAGALWARQAASATTAPGIVGYAAPDDQDWPLLLRSPQPGGSA